MKPFLSILGIAALALTATAGLAFAQPGSGPQGGPPAGAPGDGSCGDCPCAGAMGQGMGPGPGMGHGMGPGPGMGAAMMAGPHAGHLVGALDLTADQQASLETLRERLRATVEPLIEEKRAAREQLHEAIQAGSTDACALGSLVVQAHGNDAAIKAAHDAFEADFVALLTSEQLTRYEAIRDLHPRGPRGRHGGGAPAGN